SNILVAYLGSITKSSVAFARNYADENEIYVERVVDGSNIAEQLASNQEIQAVVVVDDFIGTGETAVKELTGVHDLMGHAWPPEVRVFYFAVSGFRAAQRHVDEAVSALGVPLSVHICLPLDEQDRVFGNSSRFFPDPAEREQAKVIAYKYGAQLFRSGPLG